MIIQKNTLSEQEQQQIEAIVHCWQSSGLSLSYPAADADMHFLYMKNNLLLGVCALYCTEDFVYELSLFTKKEFCSQKIASDLKKAAYDHLLKISENSDKYINIYYPVNADFGCTRSILNHWEIEHSYDEYMMELKNFTNIKTEASLPVSILAAKDQTCSFTVPEIGECFLAPLGKSMYLYGLYIEEAERNHGYGKQLLDFVLSYAFHEHAESVILQVSGDNQTALHLYKKTGFLIKETLSYYLDLI